MGFKNYADLWERARFRIVAWNSGVYIYLHKYMVSGLTGGAVKG